MMLWAALAVSGVGATASPFGLPWSQSITVLGLFGVIFILLATGVLKFNWQYQDKVRQYEDMKRLYEQEKELNRRNAEAMEKIANGVEAYGSIGKSLKKLLGVLQARHNIKPEDPEDDEDPERML